MNRHSSTMQWDISKTLSLVNDKFGRAKREDARLCVGSVNQRVTYAEFHYLAINDELKAFETSLGGRHLLEVAIGAGEQEARDYQAFMDRVGAHAVACIQSIHALEDLLAAMIYRCLDLDSLGIQLDEHQLSLQRTVARLGQDASYARLKALLESLQLHPSFAHVDALSNKAKHSAIVRPWISQDQTGLRADPVLFYFDGFTRKGIVYPQVTFEKVIVPALDFASKTRIEIGIELTALLT